MSLSLSLTGTGLVREPCPGPVFGLERRAKIPFKYQKFLVACGSVNTQAEKIEFGLLKMSNWAQQ